MKLVKEHINERFIEDSDPIEDMGIGMSNILNNAKSVMLNYANSQDIEYETQHLPQTWKPVLSRKSIIQDIYVKDKYLYINSYSNNFRYTNTNKKLSKIDFSKDMLKAAKILECVTKPEIQGKSNHLTEYNCVEVKFEIKSKYIKHFQKYLGLDSHK